MSSPSSKNSIQSVLQDVAGSGALPITTSKVSGVASMSPSSRFSDFESSKSSDISTSSKPDINQSLSKTLSSRTPSVFGGLIDQVSSPSDNIPQFSSDSADLSVSTSSTTRSPVTTKETKSRFIKDFPFAAVPESKYKTTQYKIPEKKMVAPSYPITLTTDYGNDSGKPLIMGPVSSPSKYINYPTSSTSPLPSSASISAKSPLPSSASVKSSVSSPSKYINYPSSSMSPPSSPISSPQYGKSGKSPFSFPTPPPQKSSTFSKIDTKPPMPYSSAKSPSTSSVVSTDSSKFSRVGSKQPTLSFPFPVKSSESSQKSVASIKPIESIKVDSGSTVSSISTISTGSVAERLRQISDASKKAASSSRALSPARTVQSGSVSPLTVQSTNSIADRVRQIAASPRVPSHMTTPDKALSKKVVMSANIPQSKAFTSDVTSVDVKKPVEDPIASQKQIFEKYGITFDKILPDHENHMSIFLCYTKAGARMAVQVKHSVGSTIYLDSGITLEQHRGEELTIGSSLLKDECERNDTCGFFGQEGNKAVIKSVEPHHEKKTYIISSMESERSFLEDHCIIAVPLIHFEQLEQEETKVYDTLLYVESKYKDYAFKAAYETNEILRKAIEDLDNSRKIIVSYAEEYAALYSAFVSKEKEAVMGIIAAKSSGNSEAVVSNSNYRRKLFNDLTAVVHDTRALSKIVDHSAQKSKGYTEKLYDMRNRGSGYM